MQNRYTGDVGDYGKYGLLRALARGRCLGVVWHLVPDEGHNADGKHIGYLDQPNRFRSCDPPLFDTLSSLVRSGLRSVDAVQASALFPSNTAYFDAPLAYARADDRAAVRRAWVEGALAHTEGCDLVFFDPDNGLDVPSVDRHARLGPKYAFVDELAAYWDRGQELVVYHHIGRRGGDARQQARACLSRLAPVAPDADSFALLFRRGSCRAFLVMARGAELRRRADALARGPWAEHFELI